MCSICLYITWAPHLLDVLINLRRQQYSPFLKSSHSIFKNKGLIMSGKKKNVEKNAIDLKAMVAKTTLELRALYKTFDNHLFPPSGEPLPDLKSFLVTPTSPKKKKKRQSIPTTPTGTKKRKEPAAVSTDKQRRVRGKRDKGLSRNTIANLNLGESIANSRPKRNAGILLSLAEDVLAKGNVVIPRSDSEAERGGGDTDDTFSDNSSPTRNHDEEQDRTIPDEVHNNDSVVSDKQTHAGANADAAADADAASAADAAAAVFFGVEFATAV